MRRGLIRELAATVATVLVVVLGWPALANATMLVPGATSAGATGLAVRGTHYDPIVGVYDGIVNNSVVLGQTTKTATKSAGAATDIVKYDADFALGQITSGDKATASQLDSFGASQGWTRGQTASGPVKWTDENGIVRVTIKRGSPRAPGSSTPHVEMRNAAGTRVDPYGFPVTRTSPGNHTPIVWDW